MTLWRTPPRWTIFALLALGGCAARRAEPLRDTPDVDATLAALDAAGLSRLAQLAEQIATNPRGFLVDCVAATEALTQYTVTFTRMERRGLLNLPQGPERIAVWFRRAPFSVRMLWLDEDVKYGESTYVDGEQQSRVRFTARRGLLGLPPPIIRVDPQTPVRWGEALRPVTDFGVEQLMRETLAEFDASRDIVRITVAGAVAGETDERPAVLIRLRYPDDSRDAPIQDLLIDPQTRLPLATWVRRADETLDAYYVYENLDPRVRLSDADFLLTAERPADAARPEAAP